MSNLDYVAGLGLGWSREGEGEREENGGKER
jgi:hypothetical protein